MCILGNKKHKEQKKKNKVFHNQHSLPFDVSFWVSFVYLYKEVSISMVSAFIQEMEGGYEGRKGDAELMHVRCRHDELRDACVSYPVCTCLTICELFP